MQVTMATDNLFLRCRERSNINHPPYTNTLDQLNVIGDYILDLGAIVKMKGRQTQHLAPGK